MSRRTKAYKLGHWGEFWVALRLKLSGHQIIDRRFKTKYGEVDIIALKSNKLCFYEVKYRDSAKQSDTLLQIQRSLKRLQQAAQLFLKNHPQYDALTPHFHAAIVSSLFRIRWYKDIFI